MRKVTKGKSTFGKADRELPAGERRLWNDKEYIPELRTEIRYPDRRFYQKVGCDGVAPVNVLE